MTSEQETAFWDAVKIFDAEGLLPYVILIGSWAEYIYERFLWADFKADLRTRDVDFLFKSIKRPNRRIKIIDALKEKGFEYQEDVLSGVGRFIKEDVLQIEFLVQTLGKGERMYERIPSIDIGAVSFRSMVMLAGYTIDLDCDGHMIKVPEPEAYVLQKIFANPDRSEEKQEKDLQSVEILSDLINVDRLNLIYSELTKKQQKAIMDVCKTKGLNTRILF